VSRVAIRIKGRNTIMARKTRRAVATNPTEPLDTNTVADFQVAALTAGTQLDDLAHTLVAADLAGLCRVR
jgi:hypothetical protein